MGGTLNPEKDFGSLYGEENRCPHCSALSRVERDADFRWVCGVCGGPRVPAKVEIGADGVDALKDAALHKRKGDGWRAGSIGFALLSAAALIGALVASGSSVSVGVGVVVVGIALAIVSATFSRSARGERARARADVDKAWEHAVGRFVASRKDATAKEVARALDVREAEVEGVLTALSAQGRTRVEVTNDAELVYRSDEPVPASLDEADDAAPARRRVDR